jgi:hypothetical protein
MFGIFEIILLILVRRRHCGRCDRAFWAPPVHVGKDICIGRARYVCECGHSYETGRREWVLLSRKEQRTYLWSGLLIMPLVMAGVGAVGGYFLKWHEPYWFMSVFIGFLGLLSGMICSAALFAIRGLPVVASLRQTRRNQSFPNNVIIGGAK